MSPVEPKKFSMTIVGKTWHRLEAENKEYEAHCWVCIEEGEPLPILSITDYGVVLQIDPRVQSFLQLHIPSVSPDKPHMVFRGTSVEAYFDLYKPLRQSMCGARLPGGKLVQIRDVQMVRKNEYVKTGSAPAKTNKKRRSLL